MKPTPEEFEALKQELQRTKEDLAWANSKFTGIFDQAPFSIQIFDVKGKVLLFNKASQKLWGISPEFVENFIMKEYCVFEDEQLIEQGLVASIKQAFGGEVLEMKPMRYDPASKGFPGRYRWVEPLLFPLRDSTGTIKEVVLIHNDVTLRYEAEAERDTLIKDLVQERNHLENFISIASHELKTPLTSLNLQMNILKNIVELPQNESEREVFLKFSTDALRQITRLTRHIEEMLDVTRITTGKLHYNFQKVDLSQLLSDVVSRFENQFIDQDITLKISCSEGVSVQSDPFRIEQVLTNVISNAIRYGLNMPIEISLSKSHEVAEIIVTDHGIGIAEKDFSKIFERFESIGSVHNAGGLGLGLFITSEILRELSGKISVESELGQGSKFFIQLPLR